MADNGSPLRILEAHDPAVRSLLHKSYPGLAEVVRDVALVLAEVEAEGDAAVLRYTRRFDGVDLGPGGMRVSEEEMAAAYRQVDPVWLDALQRSIQRITAFHRCQVPRSWLEPEKSGQVLGLLVRPLERVGVYVPGGTAAYPSSVLMNTIPARVAGVAEIVMTTPPDREGRINPHTLVAAAEAGVHEIYKVGGAQAVAALAFGTESVRRVDKITGPGNIYVTMAKKQVYGQVDIDMLAGPSEVLVVADDTANPAFVAADLLSQAEHDPLASALLITPSRSLAQGVQEELARQLALLPRREVAAQSIGTFGAAVITADLAQAVELANTFAPEHLELMVADPWAWLGRIKNAGAVFLGPYAPEPLGDYYAGPNHILPTGGTARFYSPLGVEAFVKRISVIAGSAGAMLAQGPDVVRLAEVEGLFAHARAVQVRLEELGGANDRQKVR